MRWVLYRQLLRSLRSGSRSEGPSAVVFALLLPLLSAALDPAATFAHAIFPPLRPSSPSHRRAWPRRRPPALDHSFRLVRCLLCLSCSHRARSGDARSARYHSPPMAGGPARGWQHYIVTTTPTLAPAPARGHMSCGVGCWRTHDSRRATPQSEAIQSLAPPRCSLPQLSRVVRTSSQPATLPP